MTCSIRPEAFRWLPSDDATQIQGTVEDVVVFLGDITQAVVAFEGGHSVRTVALNQGHRPMPGERARLYVDPSDVVILSD